MVIRSAAGGGVTRTTDAGIEQTLLPEPALIELASLGRSVAEHFGRPQDIEWAYADDRIWLVQARPMTALPPPPLRLSRIRRKLGGASEGALEMGSAECDVFAIYAEPRTIAKASCAPGARR